MRQRQHSEGPDDLQGLLFDPPESGVLPHVPASVTAHGLRAAHVAPRVGRRLPDGGFWSGRVPASHAWAYRWIDLADCGAVWSSITLDCDDRDRLQDGLDQLDLVPPNWMVPSPRGGHVTWCLRDPVGKHGHARAAPLRYLTRTAEYFSHAVGADSAFSGLGRNPAHPEAETRWLATEPYTLTKLGEEIPKGWRRPRIAATGIGRNRDMLMAGCRLAQQHPDRAVEPMLREVRDRVCGAYPDADHPYRDSELRATARSIERYRAQWQRDGHSGLWIARQAARGRRPRSGKIRSSADKRVTNEEARPWEVEGVSRRTWYRRRAKARK